jgi:hypothetical protein
MKPPVASALRSLAVPPALVLALALCGTVLAACARPGTTAPPAGPANFPELTIRGDDAPNGIYDPSVEYGRDGTGWLAYSAVKAGPDGEVHTRIARSDDRGRTWTRVADVNRPAPVAVRLPNGISVNGRWWHEVPTLVHDPDDRGRAWKLFWHRYVARMPHRNPDDRLFAFGWIAYRHAPSPAGPWSDEVALIGAGPFPLAPHATRFKIGDLHPALERYIVLTEPGSLYHRGVLYLSLQAARAPQPGRAEHDIVLIASDDHGERWRHVAVVLEAGEARAFGGDFFTGSSLVVEDGRTFLLLSLELHGKPSLQHRGTVVFEFADIGRGTLKRGPDGRPRLIKRIDARLAGGGQSDYDAQNTGGGIIMPQFDLRNLPRAFRLFNTGQRIVD